MMSKPMSHSCWRRLLRRHKHDLPQLCSFIVVGQGQKRSTYLRGFAAAMAIRCNGLFSYICARYCVMVRWVALIYMQGVDGHDIDYVLVRCRETPPSLVFGGRGAWFCVWAASSGFSLFGDGVGPFAAVVGYRCLFHGHWTILVLDLCGCTL